MAIEIKSYKTNYQLDMIQLIPSNCCTHEDLITEIHALFDKKVCCIYVSFSDYSKEFRKLGFKKYSDGYYLDNNNQNYVYMLRCVNGHLYTGWTNRLHQRISNHLSKDGAKYTKAFGPCALVRYEVFETKQEAMRREYEIKQYSKQEKERLINE